MKYEFTAYSNKWKKVIYPNEGYFIDVHASAVWYGSADDEDIELYPYIQLKDKNNKKIYANLSIVRFKFLEELNKEIELLGVFTYNDIDLRYEIDIYNNHQYTCLFYVGNGVFRDFEVIGNTKEDKKLLEE